MAEFEAWEKSYNNYTDNFRQLIHNSDDDDIGQRYSYGGDMGKKPEPFVFFKVGFKFQRRLYSPFIVSGDYSQFNDQELLLLFEQIKYQFNKKELSIILPDNETVKICATLMEELKREDFDEAAYSMEEFINANLYKVMPEFKKNIINYKHDNFISQVEAMMKEKNNSIKSERELREEFLKCFKNYPLFFSNLFDIRLKSMYSSFKTKMYMPQKFFMLISMDYIMFMDSNRFEIILKFNYDDIIYCTYISDLLYLGITIKNKKEVLNEIRFRLKSEDSRIIMEDILSYSQLYLARKTQSQHTNCKVQDFMDEAIICDMRDYKLVYQRKLPFMRIITSISSELIEIQKRVAQEKFMRNSFILKNPSFFKRGASDSKRIPSSQRFLFKKGINDSELMKNVYGDPGIEEDKSDISSEEEKMDRQDYIIDISEKNFNTYKTFNQDMIIIDKSKDIYTADFKEETVKNTEIMQYESDEPNEQVLPQDDLELKTNKKLDQAMKLLPFKFMMDNEEEEEEIYEEEYDPYNQYNYN